MRPETPWEIAEGWYDEDQIFRAIERSGSDDVGSWEKIPTDVHSREFARWLTHQYRLAMAKGVQLGRGDSFVSLATNQTSPSASL